MANRDRRKLDFEGMIRPSEKPPVDPAQERLASLRGDMRDRYEDSSGFTAQTVVGTAHAWGTGWNKEYDWESPQERPGGPWQPGRSNRTGE